MKFLDRKWLAGLFISWAGKLGEVATLVPNRVMINAALDVCAYVEATHPLQSGEYKRHQALSKLIKLFPHYSKKDIGLSIEIAVRHLFP